MPSIKQNARILEAADRDARPWSDEHGDQRWTAAAQAERHLERMDPKRRAMLEAEWEQVS